MTLPDVYSSNHFHIRIGIALIMVGLVGCASTSAPEAPYVPEAPKWSEVQPTISQPIDGKWKTENGFIDYFEKGRARVLNSKRLDPLDVLFKNIRKVGPGKYTLEVISWNNTSRITNFGTGDIEIISPTEIVFRAHPNQITGWKGDKRVMTLVSIENEASFLQELEDMGMDAGSSNIVKNQTQETNQSSQTAILVKDYLNVAATLDASATKRFLSKTAKEDFVTEFQINEKNGWRYLPERTEIIKEKINTQDGKGSVVVKLLFTGGNPPTFLGKEQSFFIAKENGLWKITGMNPAPKTASSSHPEVAPISFLSTDIQLLSERQYVDPNGFFKITPPAGWTTKKYPNDPRGKVKFIAPNVRGVSLLIIGMATDMSSIEDVVASTKKSEANLKSKYKSYKPSGGHEIVDWYGQVAVRGYFSLPNRFRQENLEFLVGKQYYNPSYAAPPSHFAKYKKQAMLSIRSLEPLLKNLSSDDARNHLVASKLRLANLNIQLGDHKVALRAIREGLEIDPGNEKLLSLKKTLTKE